MGTACVLSSMEAERRHHGRRRAAGSWARLSLAALGLAAFAMTLPLPIASAAPITMGQLAPASPMAHCGTGLVEVLEVQTRGVNPYMAPVDGVITSWSTNAAASADQQMTMKVYRPQPDTLDSYTVVARDGPRSLRSSALNTFQANIAVQAGDLIGISVGLDSKVAPVACFFATGIITDILALAETQTPDGGTVHLPPLAAGGRPNLSAILQPRPTITAVSPGSGPTAGGTAVTIRGANFEGVSAVSFGSAPAARFTTDSDGQITAIAPPSRESKSVDVTVTANGVTSAATGASRFTYAFETVAEAPIVPAPQRESTSCVVPRLLGKKIAAVRKALKRAHCRLGLVRAPRRQRAKAKVHTQQPRQGRVLSEGSTVDVVLRSPGKADRRRPRAASAGHPWR